MKKLIVLILVLVPVVSNAWVLTSDPYVSPAAGTKIVFEVIVDAGAKVDSPASATYALWYDVTSLNLTQNHIFKVKACVEGIVPQPWGRVCSSEAPFNYSVPVAPASPGTKNIGVVSGP